MNVLIFQIFEAKLFACCSQISFFIPVALDDPIDSCYKNEASNVELSLVVKKWIFKIFLNY